MSKIVNVINIDDKNGGNYWVMLPSRNVIADLEEHIKLNDKNTLNTLYQNLILHNKDINDVHELFKHKGYKLYKYDNDTEKVIDYDFNYCDIDDCACYSTFLVDNKRYCNECYNECCNDAEAEDEEEAETEA